MERQSSIWRVIHPSQKMSRNIEGNLAELFNSPPVHPAEREKTPQEYALLQNIIEKLPEFINQYDGLWIPLRPDHFKIISNLDKFDPDDRQALQHDATARYYWVWQSVRIYDPKLEPGNLFEFTKHAVHEGLHMLSFQTLQAQEPDRSLKEKRFGLSLESPNKSLTQSLDEATTEDLTKRFMQQFAINFPLLIPFWEVRARVMDHYRDEFGEEVEDIAEPAILIGENGEIRPEGRFKFYRYKPQRTQLQNVIKQLTEENRYENDRVFSYFGRAHLHGDLLALARFIHKSPSKHLWEEMFRWEYSPS